MVEQRTENPRVTSSSLVPGKKEELKVNFMYLKISKLAYFFYKEKCLLTNSIELISGGCDSILLLVILTYINQIKNKTTCVLHYNHLWQSSTFFISNDINRLSYALNKHLVLAIPSQFINSETKSRIWRKSVSQRLCQLHEEPTLYTGHTQTDNIETSIWNLIRGSSPNGLSGLKSVSTITVTCLFSDRIYTKKYFFKRLEKSQLPMKIEKPLLSISRFLSQKYIKSSFYPYWIDKINLVKYYSRSKIRYIILPLLKYYFQNNSIELSIDTFNKLNLNDSYFISTILKKLFFEFFQTKNPKKIKKLFNSLPRTLQERILFHCIFTYTSKIPNSKLIEKLLEYI